VQHINTQTCSQDQDQDHQCQDQDQDRSVRDQDQDRKWQYETKCTQSELELDDIFTFNTLFIYTGSR